MFVLIFSFSGPYVFICVLFIAKYHQVGLEWDARARPTKCVGSYVLDISVKTLLVILLMQNVDCFKTAVYALKKYLTENKISKRIICLTF